MITLKNIMVTMNRLSHLICITSCLLTYATPQIVPTTHLITGCIMYWVISVMHQLCWCTTDVWAPVARVIGVYAVHQKVLMYVLMYGCSCRGRRWSEILTESINRFCKTHPLRIELYNQSTDLDTHELLRLRGPLCAMRVYKWKTKSRLCDGDRHEG